MSGILVRPALENDIAEIVALERSVAEAPHWPDKEYVHILGTQDDAARRCLFVAEADDRMVGFAAARLVLVEPASFAELESIAVHPSMRRCGAGKALCTAVTEWSRQHGAAVVELEVRASSAGAVALYISLGYKTTGRRRGYYSLPDDDALLMQLDLAAAK